jgi:hypothetical protein
MVPVFTSPLAFLGLAALPAVLAIYFFRRRFRRFPVSSLLLWLDPRPPSQGGTKLERLQTPLLLFLELAIILLLVLAAAGPHLPLAQRLRPLVVVLDDSFSMLAQGPEAARQRARAALEEELRAHPRSSIRFVLAGERAQDLGDPATTVDDGLQRLDAWHCRAPTAQLDEAVSLAAGLGGDLALLLVLTDHPPPVPPGKGRLQWWAFGKPLPNLAFVAANRTDRDGLDRCLLEVANLSDAPAKTTLVVEAALEEDGKPPPAIHRAQLDLEPGEVHRTILQLADGTPALRARIQPDVLTIDDEVMLEPVRSRPVRVLLNVADAELRRLLQKALEATHAARLVEDHPELVFTNGTEDVPGEAWRVQVFAEKEAAAFTGPFIIDRNHPLTEGLSLQGVVWGGGKSADLAGAPVVLAGNVPLLTDAERPGGRHDLRMRLRPDLSTLQESPAWPVLIANILQWHASLAPGLSRPNIRLGEESMFTFAQARGAGPEPPTLVDVVAPDGGVRPANVVDRRIVVRGEDKGTYVIRDAKNQSVLARVAVNALARDESDLRQAVTARWGDWLDETTLRLEYQSITWAVLLATVVVFLVHLVLVSRGG